MATVSLTFEVNDKGVATIRNAKGEVLEFGRGLDRAERQAQSFDRGLAGLSRRFQTFRQGLLGLRTQIAGVAAALGIGALIRESVQAFTEEEQALARLRATLRSTGQAAGLTEQELVKMAGAFQKATKFGDEATIGAQAVLLTFTKIGREVFPVALERILDVSEALGTDLQSAAIQVGKALNDPIAGISALSRTGIQFTDQQKELIKSLVEQGRISEAQVIILKELEVQFGGVARAAAQTGSGSLTQLKNIFGDLLEVIGGLIVEALKPLVGDLTEAISKVQAFVTANRPQILEAITRGFKLIGGAILFLADNIELVLVAGASLLALFIALSLANPFVSTIASIVALVALIDKGRKEFELFDKVYQTIVGEVAKTFVILESAARLVFEAIPLFAEVAGLKIKQLFTEPLDFIRRQFNNLLDEFESLNAKVRAVTAGRLGFEQGTFSGLKLEIDNKDLDNQIDASMKKAKDKVAEIGKDLTERLRDVDRQTNEAIQDRASGDFKSIFKTIGDEGIKALEEQFDALFAKIKSKAPEATEGITDDIDELISKMLSAKDIIVSNADVSSEHLQTEKEKLEILQLQNDTLRQNLSIANDAFGRIQPEGEFGGALGGAFGEFTRSGSIFADTEERIQEIMVQMEELSATSEEFRQLEIQRDQLMMEQRLGIASSFFGGFAELARAGFEASGRENQKAFAVFKAFAIAQTIIDTIRAAQGAFAALVGIPFVGPALAAGAVAAAVAAGTARVAQIASTEPSAQFHDGGLVMFNGANAQRRRQGAPLKANEVNAVLQTGEFVVNRRGVSALEALNQGNLRALAGAAEDAFAFGAGFDDTRLAPDQSAFGPERSAGDGIINVSVPAPEVTVNNQNVFDPSIVGDFIESREGEIAVRNIVRREQRGG